MLVRVVVVLACAGAVALLATWHRDDRRCRGTEIEFVAFLNGRVPTGGVAGAADRLDRSCADATPLANSAAALSAIPRGAGAALLLAREAVRREPRTFVSWIALGDALLANGRPAEAGRAFGRAQALNPRWQGKVLPAPA